LRFFARCSYGNETYGFTLGMAKLYSATCIFKKRDCE
jgi:hypothetical protein